MSEQHGTSNQQQQDAVMDEQSSTMSDVPESSITEQPGSSSRRAPQPWFPNLRLASFTPSQPTAQVFPQLTSEPANIPTNSLTIDDFTAANPYNPANPAHQQVRQWEPGHWPDINNYILQWDIIPSVAKKYKTAYDWIIRVECLNSLHFERGRPSPENGIEWRQVYEQYYKDVGITTPHANLGTFQQTYSKHKRTLNNIIPNYYPKSMGPRLERMAVRRSAKLQTGSGGHGRIPGMAFGGSGSRPPSLGKDEDDKGSGADDEDDDDQEDEPQAGIATKAQQKQPANSRKTSIKTTALHYLTEHPGVPAKLEDRDPYNDTHWPIEPRRQGGRPTAWIRIRTHSRGDRHDFVLGELPPYKTTFNTMIRYTGLAKIFKEKVEKARLRAAQATKPKGNDREKIVEDSEAEEVFDDKDGSGGEDDEMGYISDVAVPQKCKLDYGSSAAWYNHNLSFLRCVCAKSKIRLSKFWENMALEWMGQWPAPLSATDPFTKAMQDGRLTEDEWLEYQQNWEYATEFERINAEIPGFTSHDMLITKTRFAAIIAQHNEEKMDDWHLGPLSEDPDVEIENHRRARADSLKNMVRVLSVLVVNPPEHVTMNSDSELSELTDDGGCSARGYGDREGDDVMEVEEN
ncbi:hypothetical protein BJ878DRAFT_558945 [Calycina marina]|uniref:Uncharacterized protein n=1 Tax=Calycina marina TaxID=1763456 RepID=A0A9P8CH27_9HELO|nr:hypothetical protein BJ878DRAFT_558945 [Calycina marina]